MWNQRLRVLLMIELAFLMPTMPALVGCSNEGGGNTNANQSDNSNESGGGPDTTGADAVIQINTDPEDPMIAQLTGVETDHSAIFFGEKDDSGTVTSIDSMQFFEPGEDEPLTMQFDDEGRPVFITAPDGTVATLVWEGDSVQSTTKSPDGTIEVESFNLEEGSIATANAEFESALEAFRRTQEQRLTRQDTPTTVTVIRGKVTVNLTTNGVVVGTVKDAQVTASATNVDGVIPVAFNAATEQYELAVAHRTIDLQVLIDECEQSSGSVSTWITRIGGVLTILGIACIGVSGGLCAVLGTPIAILVSGGISLTGWMSSEANLVCDDLIIDAAVEGGKGQQTVTVNASHPSLGFSTGDTVNYDLFNPQDPVTAAKEFLMSLTAESAAAIMNVTTVPTAPAAYQSYQVVFEFIPPAATISYTITGTDGYSTSETLAGDGENTSVTGKSIPGGASGVTDTVSATISVGGVQVGSATPIALTFN